MPVSSKFGSFKSIVQALAYAALGFMIWHAAPTEACSCVDQEFCEITSDTDILVSGVITDRMEEEVEADFGSITRIKYSIDPVRFYKTLPGLVFAEDFPFRSAESSAACGVDLVVGETYVVGLDFMDGALFASLCGVALLQEDVSNVQLEVLENGGECL